jgi:transcriptional regulator with GAF, ATPase, and Fis domain
MAFRDTELSSLVRHNPRAAAKVIFEAYERAGFQIIAAARALAVTNRTLSRWIVVLGIDERIRKARAAYRERRAAS